MVLKIGEKDYKLEYTFEAALNEECIEKTISMFGGMADASKNMNNKDMLKEIASMPKTVVSLFYAGLLEHNPVETENDAKALLKQYFKENYEAKDANFYGMATAIIGQMEEDGFFKQIGLVKPEEEEQDEEEQKIPQDHKKKTAMKKATEA
ncbi:hypothetical protein V8Q34_14645 [Blautia sp. JLR.GB0024]|uniref:hypothetical protein n=1 Tax=Blautia sp. JLR.GB0024 TaxID=3123295 RepID=UPI00300752ED